MSILHLFIEIKLNSEIQKLLLGITDYTIRSSLLDMYYVRYTWVTNPGIYHSFYTCTRVSYIHNHNQISDSTFNNNNKRYSFNSNPKHKIDKNNNRTEEKKMLISKPIGTK